MTTPQPQPRYLYIEVEQGGDYGFWEIDTELRKALFRDYEHKRLGDPKTDGVIHDWSEIHNTITDYIQKEMKIKNVKEVIPDVKYIYSEKEPFCSWSIEGTVAFEPGKQTHCTALAEVYHNGEPYCLKHAHVDF